MALEIIHTKGSYIVVDNEQGHWTPQYIYARYLDARHSALVWKQAAKLWRWRCRALHLMIRSLPGGHK